MPCAGGRIQRVLQLVFITMDEIDKDVLQDIGINVIGDGYTDEDGCWYDFDELWEAIWCGVFGFCSCGDTGEQFDRLLEVLRLINNMDKKREERMLTLAKLKERQDLHIYLYILDEKSYKFILCFTQTGSSSDNGISGELVIGTATSLNNGLKAVVILKDEDSILDVEEFARSAREAVDNLILAIKTQPCTSAASKALDSLYAIQDEYIDSVNRNTEL